MKLVSRSLYAQARDAILELIDQKQEFMGKLPSEQELSEVLGVSRNTVREALRSLENDGFVASRHGVGTFIIRNSKSIKSNITTLESATKVITSHGYLPGTKSVMFDRRRASGRIAKHLRLAEGAEVLYIERVRTAGGVPVVCVEDYIPYVTGMYERYQKARDESLLEFLQHFDCKVSFCDCTIHAVLGDARLQEKLSLTAPRALLLLEQIHYSLKGVPVLYSDSYFLSEKFEFNVIRRCID